MSPTDKQTAIIVISVVFPLAAVLTVGLRLRARVLTSERIKADDYWIVIAAVFTTGTMIPYIISATIACAGIHNRDCTSTQQIRFSKIVFAIQFLYLASISTVKISLLLFYKRVFPNKRFGYAIAATMAFVSLWFVAFFFAQLFEIWPISGNWESSPNGMYAWIINEEAMNSWLCGLDVFADVLLLLLPIPMIASLRMSTRDKLALLGIFSLGLLTVIASGMRLLYAERFIRVDRQADKTYLLADVIIWSCIEPSLGIVAACLPLLHPFFKRHSPEKIVGAHSNGYSSVRTNNPARVPRTSKEFEEFTTMITQFHENIIE